MTGVDAPFDAPEPEIEPDRSERRISAAWIVPVLALVIALVVGWRHFSSQGPLIEIEFETASGVTIGQTKLKHRDVEVGVVEDMKFSQDVQSVLVYARMDPEIAPYLDASTQFWVVKPRISATTISGLDTVLSGAYIAMTWDRTPGERLRSFKALEEPPLTPPGTPGMRVTLRAEDGGSMSVGAPVFFKRIPVGRIEKKTLTPSGTAVEFEVFVNDPHHQRLTRATRFWNASGIEAEVTASGASVRVESLVSLLEGGVAFDNLPTAERLQAASNGDLFTLYESENDARESLFEDTPESDIRVAVRFSGSVRGLKTGAPVEYRGLTAGEVTGVAIDFDEETGEADIVTTLLLQPKRIGVETVNYDTTLGFLENAVGRGLRAKLATGNILTGALYVDLAEIPDSEPASIILEPNALPLFPSAPSDLETLAATAQELLAKVREFPLEEIGVSAARTMDSVAEIAASDALKRLPERVEAILLALESLPLETLAASATGAMDGAAGFLANPELQEVPGQLNAILAKLEALPLEAMIANADQTLAGASALMNDEALQNAPEQLGAIFAKLEALPLEAMIANADQTLSGASALMNDEALQNAPEQLAAILANLEALPLETLAASATGAMDGAAGFLANPELQEVPGQLNAILAKIEALPLETLSQAATDALNGAAGVFASPEFRALPAQIGGILANIESITAAAEAEDLPEQLSAILEKLRDLPLEELLASLQRSAYNVETLMASEGVRMAPDRVDAILNDVQRLTGNPALQQAPAQVANTLAYAQQLLANPALQQTPEQVAAMLADIRRVTSSPGVQQSPEQIALILAYAQQLMGNPSLQAAPDKAAAVMDTANALLYSFERLDTAGNVNATLNSARRAMDEMPALLAQLRATTQRAEGMIANLSPGSELNYEMLNAIRDIRDAARAVTILADTVEERPNSLILGK